VDLNERTDGLLAVSYTDELSTQPRTVKSLGSGQNRPVEKEVQEGYKITGLKQWLKCKIRGGGTLHLV